MRCSECHERNSVAAKECRSCGHKFQAKPIPKSVKIGAAVAGGLIILGVIAASVVPILTDPNRALASIAKRVAQGPTDANDAKKATAELDEALKNFLKQNGSLPTAQLTKKLQDGLSESAFEVHVFDLPRGLSIVEVDTMLQANDYLLLKNGSTVKVTPLPGMEVFDTARVITDSSAPVLVILGHTAGQGVHKPLVRAYALLPDDTVDQTAKTIPEVKADGVAAFAKNNKDINLDYSFYSLGAGEKLFDAGSPLPQGLADDSVHGTMRWQNGKYEAQPNTNRSQLSALYAVAKCIATPAQAGRYKDILGENGTAYVNSRKTPLATLPEFKILRLSGTAAPEAPQPAPSRHRHGKSKAASAATGAKNEYLLASKAESFTVQLSQGASGAWSVSDVKLTPQAEATALVNSQSTTTPPTGQAAPITELTSTTSTTSTATTTSTTTTSGAAADMSPLTTGTLSDKELKESKEKLKAVLESTKDKTDKAEKVSMTQSSTGTESGAADKEKTDKETAKDKKQSKEDSASDQTAVSEDKQTGVAASVHSQIDASQVRVRSGPGPNFKLLTTIARGAKLTIIGKSNGWYKIKANGQTGFIYGGLVDYKTPDAYETITVHKVEGLTDDHEKSIGSSKPGDRLVVLGSEKNGKLKVQLSSGQTAYINKNAVEQSQDTPQFVP
ncbi:MAG: SH3 domain-containing protein [Candidatus Obscuribacterales bacterium]|nr:SH3 domain-containing protein [Candidatus Obscuribacterales bacterium]